MSFLRTVFPALSAVLCVLALCACSSAPDPARRAKSAANMAEGTQTLSQKKLINIIREQETLFEWYTRADNAKSFDAVSRVRKVQTLWDDYLLTQPEDVDALIIYAKFRRTTSTPQDAYKIFQHIDRLDGGIAVVKQQLATFEGESGEFDKAFEHMKLAVTLAPEEPVYHDQMGRLLLFYREDFVREGKMTQDEIDRMFVDSFAKASALAPNRDDYKWRYAQSFYDAGRADWETSLKVWDDLLSHASLTLEKDTINVNRARVLIELYRDDEAEEILNSVTNPHLQEAKTALLNLIKNDRNSAEAKVLKKAAAARVEKGEKPIKDAETAPPDSDAAKFPLEKSAYSH